MSIQKQWSEFHLCDICMVQFNSSNNVPLTLVCGHTFCKKCLSKLKNRQCPHDKNVQIPDLAGIPINYAILKLLDQNGLEIPAPIIKILEDTDDDLQQFYKVKEFMDNLAMFLKPLLVNGAQALNVTYLTRPMLKKLVTIVNSQLLEIEGRARIMRTARSLAERTITELLIIHQGQQQLSHQLWAAVRCRGCQFLGPVMQEETLKYIQKVLESGQALSRKNIVLYVVEQLEKQFPQASRTSVGHVVQLLYRSSCFNVDKRDGDSSLMQLKEEYRNHDALRKEHDTQIVKIAMEAGLRIGPEQWSSLLYGDQKHKSHMQSIIDKLIAMGCTSGGVNELVIALERAQDPYSLSEMVPSLEELLNRKLDSEKDSSDKGAVFSLSACAGSLEALISVVSKFVEFMKQKQKPNNSEMVSGSQQLLGNKYKTGLCRDLARPGGCPRGTNCTYAHSQDELDRYRVISQQSRGKGKSLDINNKPKTSLQPYTKPSQPITSSMPVTQSYQLPPQSYNDPANFPVNYDRPLGQYSGEQLISRGGSQRTAPTRPSPPTTGMFHDPMGGYRSKGGEPDMFTGSFKGPAMYNAPSGVLGGSAEVYQQPPPAPTSLSALRMRRENIKQMMEQAGGDQLGGMGELQDDFFQKPSSLPNEHFLSLDEQPTSNRSSISDEEPDVGFINKTRSFPDLSKSSQAHAQQQLAIQEARLRKREQDLDQRELHLHRLGGNFPRGVYSREQQMYGGGGYGANWSGQLRYTGQQSSQPPTPGGYVYEQQWSRPHGNITQEMARMSLHDTPNPMMSHGYDHTQEDALIAQFVANQEQQKLHHGYGAAQLPGYSPSLGASNYSFPSTAAAYGSSGYTLAQKFQ
ncbi:roquin-2-like isoform X2 [Dysidea avara]|uniref:roquin-2-like isoform X2 n=1 Tax=Dysidea avara TaxID=196820 RepID=UPI00331C010A